MDYTIEEVGETSLLYNTLRVDDMTEMNNYRIPCALKLGETVIGIDICGVMLCVLWA